MKKKEILSIFVLAVLVTGLSSGFFWIFWYNWCPPGHPLRYMRLVGEGVPEGFAEIDVLIPAVDRVKQLPFMADFLFWFLVLLIGHQVIKYILKEGRKNI